jgi:hypothetical protein
MSTSQEQQQSQSQNVNIQIVQLTPEALNALIEFGVTRQAANRLSLDHYQEIKEANSVLNAHSARHDRHGEYTIEYYPKDIDHDPIIVSSRLRGLGFVVVEKPAKVQEVPTNAIWFGIEVPIEDVKLVALTLIRAGVALKTIKPFIRSEQEADWAKLIQIGADADYADSPALTASFIDAQHEFTRNE